MRSLHRVKAIAAYDGARITLKNEMSYPSYMLLKEAARGVLAYIAEDSLDQEISDKTKLSRLLDLVNEDLINKEDRHGIEMLIDAENRGLTGILTMDIAELKTVKKAVKHLIAAYMKEPI